jgi:acyl carrier protein
VWLRIPKTASSKGLEAGPAFDRSRKQIGHARSVIDQSKFDTYILYGLPLPLLRHGGGRAGLRGAGQSDRIVLRTRRKWIHDFVYRSRVTMTNQQKLVDIFSGSLGIAAESITDDLKYNSIPEWDSIGHMTLVTGVETEFDVMLDTSDIIDMSSVRIAKEILARYGVSFEE